MANINLKQLTDSSWIVSTNDTAPVKIGILCEQSDDYVLMSAGQVLNFPDKESISEFFGCNTFEDMLVTGKVEDTEPKFINGYPVAQKNISEAGIDGNLHLFTKSTNADKLYAAGYFCLKFPACWRPAFCPKLETLGKYEYAGPFKTKQEMSIILARKSRESK